MWFHSDASLVNDKNKLSIADNLLKCYKKLQMKLSEIEVYEPDKFYYNE